MLEFLPADVLQRQIMAFILHPWQLRLVIL
jgi:hypothetical protein